MKYSDKTIFVRYVGGQDKKGQKIYKLKKNVIYRSHIRGISGGYLNPATGEKITQDSLMLVGVPYSFLTRMFKQVKFKFS